MQKVNLFVQNNQDFCLTLTLQDSLNRPLQIDDAKFYMSIKEKASGNINIATLSNDEAVKPQGKIYLVDAKKSKIKLFLQREVYKDKKYVNTWYYDLVMRNFTVYYNIMQGQLTILDSVTNVGL